MQPEGTNCQDQEDQWPLMLVEKLFLVFLHIEGITLGEEKYEASGRASGMGLDGIGKTGDRTSGLRTCNESERFGIQFSVKVKIIFLKY